MRRGNRHARALGPRLRTFASLQTIDARWNLVRLHALSSTHRWRGAVRQRRSVGTIRYVSSVLSGEIRNRDIVLHHCACGSKEALLADLFPWLTPWARACCAQEGALRDAWSGSSDRLLLSSWGQQSVQPEVGCHLGVVICPISGQLEHHCTFCHLAATKRCNLFPHLAVL
jgi:hypothetical protein